MTSEIVFREHQIKCLTQWGQGLGEALSALWVAQCGRKMQFSKPSLQLCPDTELRAELAAHAAAMPFELALREPLGRGLLFLGADLAGPLAGIMQKEDDDALGEHTSIEAEDRESLEKLLKESMEAIAEVFRLAASPKLKAEFGEAAWMYDSSWEDEVDPIPSGELAVFEFLVGIQGFGRELPFVLLLQAQALHGRLAKVLEPMPRARAKGPFLVYSNDRPTLIENLQSTLPEVKECVDFDALLKSWAETECGGAVVELETAELTLLPKLRALTEIPEAAKRRMIIVLKEPNSLNVIRCGRLGLFDVLASGFAPADLNRRLEK